MVTHNTYTHVLTLSRLTHRTLYMYIHVLTHLQDTSLPGLTGGKMVASVPGTGVWWLRRMKFTISCTIPTKRMKMIGVRS